MSRIKLICSRFRGSCPNAVIDLTTYTNGFSDVLQQEGTRSILPGKSDSGSRRRKRPPGTVELK